ncbi:hypothetical protein ES703_39213 [subsurface metagenome]
MVASAIKISRREMRKKTKSGFALTSILKLLYRVGKRGICALPLLGRSLTVSTVATIAPSRTTASAPRANHSQKTPSPVEYRPMK